MIGDVVTGDTKQMCDQTDLGNTNSDVLITAGCYPWSPSAPGNSNIHIVTLSLGFPTQLEILRY